MDTTMELDELKTAWRTLDRRLEQQNALNLKLFVDTRLDKLRSRLRPLYWGQMLQMTIGVLLVLFAVGFWTQHRDVTHLLLAGVIVHVYGVLMIICGGVTLGLMSRIDYAAPVLAIQKQLAAVRRLYIGSGMLVGVSWWLLWMPFMMVAFAALFGADLYANAPSVIYGGSVVGVLGLIATAWLRRWSRDPRRPRLARFVEDSVTGGSLRNAQVHLDEIARFERE
jgi:hypothetical protein